MKNTAKKTLITTFTAIALSTSAFSSFAAKHEPLTDKQEEINQAVGLGSGLVLGAVVAGPLGAIVAGVVGALIGDDINDTQKIKDSQHALMVKQTELRDMQVAFNKLKTENQAQLAAFDSILEDKQTKSEIVLPEIIANIQFKTASFLIEDHYKAQLDIVAEQLKQNKNLKIELSGFADQRGDSNYNQILSEQRNESVKNYLLSQYVDEKQIISQAFGESHIASEADTSYEDNFFDRRVMLKVSFDQNAEMTAATHTDL